MTFDEFVDQTALQLGFRPTKIMGISNSARVMDDFIFFGGPNLQNIIGTRPYALCSKITFSIASHLYFCLNFGANSPQLAQALQRLDPKRINNSKIAMDDTGLFISTSGLINTGKYTFNPLEDIRVDAESFIYFLEGPKNNSDATVDWIKSHFKGNIQFAGASEGNIMNVSSNITLHPLNQILYGPPGTGKTYNAINHAIAIIRNIDVDEIIAAEKTTPSFRTEIKAEFDRYLNEGRINFVTFHQSYSYEEFVEGIKPIVNENGEIEYKIIDGAFKKICTEAARKEIFDFEDLYDEFTENLKINPDIKLQTLSQKREFTISLNGENVDVLIAKSGRTHTVRKKEIKEYVEKNTSPSWWPSYVKSIGEYIKQTYKTNIQTVDNEIKNFVLIIDEINRGNISKIFGELITLIEDSKRIGAPEQILLKLAYTGTEADAQLFGVPKNVYIIGTMNSTDRSIALIDTALRRRFTFIEYPADHSLLATDVDGINISSLLSVLNTRIEYLLDRDHLIGHSYLMGVNNKNELCKIFRNKLIPLLQEFFYNDFEKIQLVLGDNKDWKKPPHLRIIVEKSQGKAKTIFGSDIDGYEERIVYNVREDITSENYDSVSADVFVSIYDNQVIAKVEA